MRENASIVEINNTICKLMYFINVIIGDKNHELAFVQCYGAALMRKSKDWFARNQNNVSEWSDMSICGLLFQ
jgi:hypothetical protein